MSPHAVRERTGARPLHLASCWCWCPPPYGQAPAAWTPSAPARRSWIARVLLAGGLVEEVEPRRG